MGGETVINEALFCCKCRQLPKSVWESSCCFSIFCKDCIRSVSDSQCPQCHTLGTHIRFAPNIPLQRIINEIEVRCKHHRCGVRVKYSEIDIHEFNCPFKPVECTCGTVVAVTELGEHKEKQCQKRLIQCVNTGCEELIAADSVAEHNEVCLFACIPCQFCAEKLQRKFMQTHVSDECIQAPVDCPYKEVGCTEKLVRIELPSHADSHVHTHMSLLMNTVTAQQTTIKELQGKIKEFSDAKKQEQGSRTVAQFVQEIADKIEVRFCGANDAETVRRWEEQEKKLPSLMLFWFFGLFSLLYCQFLVPWGITLFMRLSGRRYEQPIHYGTYLSFAVYCILMFYYIAFQHYVRTSWKFRCCLSVYFGFVWAILTYCVIF